MDIQLLRQRSLAALCSIFVSSVLGAAAFGGTVRGVVTGPKPGTRLRVIADDGSEAGQISVTEGGHYSISLPPGRYRVQCASAAPGNKNNPVVYIFALDAPVTRDMALLCG
jgi:hypothetical protein